MALNPLHQTIKYWVTVLSLSGIVNIVSFLLNASKLFKIIVGKCCEPRSIIEVKLHVESQ